MAGKNAEVIRKFLDEVLENLSGDDEITLNISRPVIETEPSQDGYKQCKRAAYKTLTLTITQFDDHKNPNKEVK